MRIREWMVRGLFTASLAFAGVSIYLFHETTHVKAGLYGVILAVTVLCGCLIYDLALDDPQVVSKLTGGESEPDIDLRDRLAEQTVPQADEHRVRV